MIPVLMYHALEDSDHPSGIHDEGERVYVLQRDVFEVQMSLLQQEGFGTCLLGDGMSSPSQRVMLTFDDGRESDFTLTLPILQRFGFKAYFFITAGEIGQQGFLSRSQVRALAGAGMVVGSHGMTHAYFEDIGNQAVRAEMSQSKAVLEDIIGNPVDYLSVPGGRIRPDQCGIAAELGYRNVFTSELGYFDAEKPGFSIPRIAVKRGHTLQEFQSMVRLSPAYMLKARLKKSVLDTGKKLMGNRSYDRLREWVLEKKKVPKAG